MKKLLLSLATVALGLTATAGEVTFDFKSSTYGIDGFEAGKNNDDFVTVPATMNNEGVTITLNATNETGNKWRFWNDGLRAYSAGKPYFEVAAPTGQNLTSVVIVSSSGATFKVENSDLENYWSGSSNSVTFVYTSSGNLAVQEINVTYGDTPALPSPNDPKGNLSVSQALSLLDSDNNPGLYVVKGIVSEVRTLSSNGQLTYFISDNGENTNTLEIYNGLGLNKTPFTEDTKVVKGATVEVQGYLTVYNGTKEMNANNFLISYQAPAVEQPKFPTETISVAQALTYLSQGYTGTATVKGLVTDIEELSISYGNATYTIKDSNTATEYIYVFRGKYLNGESFNSEDQLMVGDEVVVTGTLQYYGSDNIPEFLTGNKILSINPVERPSEPEPGPQPPTPESGKPITFNFTEYTYGISGQEAGVNNDNYINNYPAVMTYGDITVTLNGSGDGNKWRFWNDGLRAYTAGSPYFTVTTTNGTKITAITWTLGKNISITEEGSDSELTYWKGNSNSVTLVPVNASGNNAIVTLTVYYGDLVYNPEPEPEIPDAPEGTISVSEALKLISDGYEGQATVKGIITEISEVETAQYGNATYTIKDRVEDSLGLVVFRGYWKEGEKFTSKDQIAVGATVVVSGKLINYNGTYEFTSGSVIDEYTAPTSGINGINSDNANVEYYNLQGVRVNNTVKGGLYIIRQGDKTSKVIVR